MPYGAALRVFEPKVLGRRLHLLEDFIDKNSEHRGDDLFATGQEAAKLKGRAEHPLSEGHVGKNFVHQVGGGILHAARPATRAARSGLFGERKCLLMATARASELDETVLNLAAAQEPLELFFDKGFIHCAMTCGP